MDATEQAEFDRISGELATATSANEKLTADMADVSNRYRDFFHRTKFAAVAIAAGVNPLAVDTFYRESAYQADSDEFDTDAASSLISANRERLSFLFNPAEAETTAATTTATTPPATPPAKVVAPTAPGGSRGRANPPTAARLRITRAQQSNVDFMVANDKKIKEAAAKGLLDFET